MYRDQMEHATQHERRISRGFDRSTRMNVTAIGTARMALSYTAFYPAIPLYPLSPQKLRAEIAGYCVVRRV
jgi:hypothetical protein